MIFFEVQLKSGIILSYRSEIEELLPAIHDWQAAKPDAMNDEQAEVVIEWLRDRGRLEKIRRENAQLLNEVRDT